MTEDVKAEAAMAEKPAESETSTSSAPTVMLLGATELTGELVAAFQRLGAVVVAVDRNADAPASGAADRSLVVKLTDPDELAAVIEREQPDYVVTEAADESGKPVIANDALSAIADRGVTDVVPTARSARLCLDREGLRRLASDELGLPTAPFWFAGTVEELSAIAEHAGFPLVVRPVEGAPGEGESVLLRAEDVEPAWERAIAAGGRMAATRVMAETSVDVDFEVTLLTVRTVGSAKTSVQFCEPIGHQSTDGDVLECWQPQPMTSSALEAAKSIAARIVGSLGGRGVFGVELLVKGDEVYFSDVNVALDDTGLVTLRSQRLSQFELHARAILGLPVDTIMITPGAAHVVHPATTTRADLDDTHRERASRALSDALTVAESDVRVFASADSYPRRRLGVALATAADATTARQRVGEVSSALRKFW